MEAILKRKATPATEGPTKPRGELDRESSIFHQLDHPISLSQSPASNVDASGLPIDVKIRDFNNLGRVLDPKPIARQQWQRRMVMRSVRRRGRLTRKETILRTERTSLSKSHFFKTSVKKLTPLARQIAGKDIDDAILQMRFSKKKAARDIYFHLKHAKNEAIVRRGMGLGPDSRYIAEAKQYDKGQFPDPPQEPDRQKHSYKTKEDDEKLPGWWAPKPKTPLYRAKDDKPSPLDMTKMYIDQAWVGRGPYGFKLDHRAMGRTNIMRPPHTSISILLKEEKTKVRMAKEEKEREERKRARKLWTQLPDRKVTAQRQYYCW